MGLVAVTNICFVFLFFSVCFVLLCISSICIWDGLADVLFFLFLSFYSCLGLTWAWFPLAFTCLRYHIPTIYQSRIHSKQERVAKIGCAGTTSTWGNLVRRATWHSRNLDFVSDFLCSRFQMSRWSHVRPTDLFVWVLLNKPRQFN